MPSREKTPYDLDPIPSFFAPYPLEENDVIFDTIMSKVLFKPENSDLALKIKNLAHVVSYTNYIRTCHAVSELFVDYSHGAFLDELVKLSGITRIAGTLPVASVKITSQYPMTLLRGTKFTSDEGELAYLMTDTDIFPDGTVTTLHSDKEGDFKINALYNHLEGIKSVEILGKFIQHSTDETDEQLRRRFKASLARFSTAGSKESYRYWVLTVGGVKQAEPYNDGAGKVLIVYDGAAELAQVILDTLKPIQPITDSVRVKKADEIEVNPTITLTYRQEADINTVQKKVRQTLNTVFDEIKIGHNIPHSKFYAYITDNITVSSSEVDQDTLDKIKFVPRDSILKLGTLNFQTKYRL